MAVSTTVYGHVGAHLMDIDWTMDDIKLALLADTYTPNQDSHEFFSDVSASEVAGTGYTAGGQSLTTVAVSYDATNNRTVVTADTVTYSTVTLSSVQYAVLYRDTGTAGTSPLVFYVDFGTTQDPAAQDFPIVWNGGVVFRETATTT